MFLYALGKGGRNEKDANGPDRVVVVRLVTKRKRRKGKVATGPFFCYEPPMMAVVAGR